MLVRGLPSSISRESGFGKQVCWQPGELTVSLEFWKLSIAWLARQNGSDHEVIQPCPRCQPEGHRSFFREERQSVSVCASAIDVRRQYVKWWVEVPVGP